MNVSESEKKQKVSGFLPSPSQQVLSSQNLSCFIYHLSSIKAEKEYDTFLPQILFCHRALI